MPKQIKIVTFINDREGREQGEEELARLVNEGYKIKAAGGGTGAEMVWGFVILQRHTDEIRETKSLLQIALEDDDDEEETSPSPVDETRKTDASSDDNAAASA